MKFCGIVDTIEEYRCWYDMLKSIDPMERPGNYRVLVTAWPEHINEEVEHTRNVYISVKINTTGYCMNKLEELYTVRVVIDGKKAGFNVLNDLDSVFINYFIRYALNYDN